MKKKIIIVGGGGHARVLLDILKLGPYSVIGFTDQTPKDGFGAEYLGDDEDVKKRYNPDDVQLVNGIGSVRRPEQRRTVYENFKSRGYQFCSVIHPQAIISPTAHLKEGVQVIAGAIINTGALIKENAIINTAASVDHDCIVGAHSHIAPGVNLSGNVEVGEGCHVGIGAKVIQGVTIGDNALIGAGALIIDNVPAQTVDLGVSSSRGHEEQTVV